jgi:hypothetical protein
VAKRVLSILTPDELRRRLKVIGMSQRAFARYTRIAWPTVSEYCNAGPIPVGVHLHLLLVEQTHALRKLRQRIDRYHRTIDAVLLIADEPLSASPLPPRKRKRSESGKVNLLKKYLPKIPPGPPDPPPKPEWMKMVEAIGYVQSPNHDAVARALLRRRPNPPRLGPDDDEPRTRTTGPI